MPSTLRNTVVWAGALVSLFLLPTPSEALLTGVKSMGRAGAVIAQPLDSLSAAYNPAGSAFIGNRWDLGIGFIEKDGNAHFSGNDTFNGKLSSHDYGDILPIPEFGVSQNICEREYEYEFTLGFIVYNRDFYKTKYKGVNTIYGTSKLGMEYLHYVAAPTFSVNFGCDHALGITADFHGHRLKVTGLENFADRAFSKNPDNVTNKGYDYSGGIGFTVGWISRLSPWATVGLSWSPKVAMGTLTHYKGLLAKKGKWDIPERYAGGVAIDLPCDVVVEFDVEHLLYTDITQLNNPFLHSDNLKPFFGKDHGSGWGWRNQTTFNVGLEWEINNCWSTRIGYRHIRIPVLSSQALHNTLIPNIVEDFVTVGASSNYDGCNEISFFVSYGWKNSVSSKHAIPDSLGGGKVTLNENRWLGGISWGRIF